MLMRHRIIIAVAIEVTYAVITRTWLRQQLDGAHLELAVSAFRIATIIAYWALFRELIRSRPRTPSTLRHPLLSAGVLVALAIPVVLHGTLPGGGFGTSLVFALTSIIVGLREMQSSASDHSFTPLSQMCCDQYSLSQPWPWSLPGGVLGPSNCLQPHGVKQLCRLL